METVTTDPGTSHFLEDRGPNKAGRSTERLRAGEDLECTVSERISCCRD